MDHRRLCGPSLKKKSLCGAYLYCASQSSVFTECVWCACTNVKESKWHRVFVLLFLYRSSQYINSRGLTDCTDCVTVWMTLTLGGCRCKVRQYSDIISIERSYFRIFDSRYVEVRTNILQETENLTICQFILQIVQSMGVWGKRLTVYREIGIYLAGFAESDLYKLNVTRFSSF